MNRRAFLGGAVAGALAVAGVAKAALERKQSGVFTVGVMTNLTHAPMLAGLGSGRIARALGNRPLEVRAFRAGPRVVEALLGGAIDAGTSGPAPVVIHHARHARGPNTGLRVVGGCSSGGASLVTAKGTNIAAASDLRGKRLAITQLGTTQDVALRTYLAAHGLKERAAGGDVEVLAIANATILDEMRKGDLHGAWLAEPWATRLVKQLGATRFVDERDLWHDRKFATAILATTAERAEDERVRALALALEAEVTRGLRDPEAMLDEAYAELKRHVGNPGARSLIGEAAGWVDFTSDPLRASVERFGMQAAVLGLCDAEKTSGLFV